MKWPLDSVMILNKYNEPVRRSSWLFNEWGLPFGFKSDEIYGRQIFIGM